MITMQSRNTTTAGQIWESFPSPPPIPRNAFMRPMNPPLFFFSISSFGSSVSFSPLSSCTNRLLLSVLRVLAALDAASVRAAVRLTLESALTGGTLSFSTPRSIPANISSRSSSVSFSWRALGLSATFTSSSFALSSNEKSKKLSALFAAASRPAPLFAAALRPAPRSRSISLKFSNISSDAALASAAALRAAPLAAIPAAAAPAAAAAAAPAAEADASSFASSAARSARASASSAALPAVSLISSAA